MVAAFAGIFQILVKMWGAQSEQRGPGSRGGSWRRRRASQGRSRACYGRVLSTCRGGGVVAISCAQAWRTRWFYSGFCDGLEL